ncbi:hypothetical protein KC318_g69 [Hortaea werneckii]|nr:hypothetical protein KC334_g67 [Hortaea werneckii]KAI7028400.1 hypothetical protein KC355_g68 [Hortaea werneckii]KAI7676790.1 hypothetical protein KC318_g69 [Hortaea werneckii]
MRYPSATEMVFLLNRSCPDKMRDLSFAYCNLPKCLLQDQKKNLQDASLALFQPPKHFLHRPMPKRTTTSQILPTPFLNPPSPGFQPIDATTTARNKISRHKRRGGLGDAMALRIHAYESSIEMQGSEMDNIRHTSYAPIHRIGLICRCTSRKDLSQDASTFTIPFKEPIPKRLTLVLISLGEMREKSPLRSKSSYLIH